MKSRSFITALLLVGASSLSAASIQVPQYSIMNMPVSNGYFHGGMLFVDLNNDGWMDLIVKGRDLNNGWATDVKAVYNDAGMWSTEASLPNDGQCWERTLETIDFNNDGWTDYLLLSSWGYELYRNNGDGSFAKVENFALDSNISIDGGNGNDERWYTGLSAVADFNLDGWNDLVVMDGNGNPALHLNNHGDGSFTFSDNSGLCPQRGGTIAVGDYNNDGYPDLLVNGWNDEVGGHCVRINQNNGDGTFTTHHPGDAVMGTEKGQTMFVDVNGDGWLDIFVTGEAVADGWNKQALIYVNDKNGGFSKVDANLRGTCKSGCEWADVNGDGFIEIIYAGETDNDSRSVVVINEGELTFSSHEDLLGRARGGAVVAAFDSNGNGFPNLSVMGYNDDGGPHFSIWNGLCNNRYANANPNAPANLTATEADGKVTFKWEPGSDAKTPQEALRYNLYVKFADGTVYAIVPSDPETGHLRQGNVNAALTTCQYEMRVDGAQIAEWGVQTIDGGKASSAFAKATLDAIQEQVYPETPRIYVRGRHILSTAEGNLTVFDANGRQVSPYHLPVGVYVATVTTSHGEVIVNKVIIK